MNWAQEPACTPGALRGVCPGNAANAILVGDGGTICVANGGTPQCVTSPTYQNLRGVTYVSSVDRAYAVGDNGTIVKGNLANLSNWTLDQGGVGPQLNAVSLLWTSMGLRGMAVGQNKTVKVFTGASWMPLSTYSQPHHLTGVALALDSSVGQGWVAWVVGCLQSDSSVGIIAKYTGSWSFMSLVLPPKFNAVSAYSKTLVVAAGAGGAIFRKQVADMWFPMTVPSGCGDLAGIVMADSENGYAVGAGGTILNSCDGACTWNTMTNPMTSPTNLYGVAGPGVSPDWAVGDPDVNGGTILNYS